MMARATWHRAKLLNGWRNARDQKHLDELLVRALCRWFEARVRKVLKEVRR